MIDQSEISNSSDFYRVQILIIFGITLVCLVRQRWLAAGRWPGRLVFGNFTSKFGLNQHADAFRTDGAMAVKLNIEEQFQEVERLARWVDSHEENFRQQLLCKSRFDAVRLARKRHCNHVDISTKLSTRLHEPVQGRGFPRDGHQRRASGGRPRPTGWALITAHRTLIDILNAKCLCSSFQ